MFGWLRRNRSDAPGDTGWAPDPAPTPDERRDELLSAYLDDDLTAAERQELDARLQTDPALRDALDGMRVVRDTLATLEVVRAPRSFAIPADAPAAPRGFSPVDLFARAGAMVAAAAFVVVLVGDLGGSGTPVVQDEASTDLSSAAAVADSGVSQAGGGAAAGDGANVGAAGDTAPLEETAVAASLPGLGPAGEGDDDAEAPVQPTPEAPVLDSDSDGLATATATSAERFSTAEAGDEPGDDAGADPADAPQPLPGVATDATATTDAAALPPSAGGALDPTEDPADAPATENTDAGDSAGAAAPPADAADVERVDADDSAGTESAESALGSQPEETAALDGANRLVEDGREVSNLAIGLGAVTAAFGGLAGWLWWRRRDGTVDPA